MAKSENLKKLVKLFIVILLFALWILYRAYFSQNKTKIGYEYEFQDNLLQVIYLSLTNYLSQHLQIRDYLMIIGGCSLDILFLTFSVVFILRAKSWLFPINAIMFYGFRGMNQALTLFEIIDTHLFDNPGFPSIVIPYFRACDFFYSGHTGIALIFSLNFGELEAPLLNKVGIFVTLYEGFMMSVIRAHYSIDILFALMCAHYFYFISKKVSYYLDEKIPICGQRLSTKYQSSLSVNSIKNSETN